MANSKKDTAFDSDLYKAFFDNATLSDLTIRLSDRTVSVHRIVLCRRSEYFAKLLTGPFQESGAREVTLQEDDAESMVALLRYIYGLSYNGRFSNRPDRLQPHAKVYVVAEKYQLQGLKLAVSDNMERIIDSGMDLAVNDAGVSIDDFVSALRTVVTGITTDNDHVWEMMVEACVVNLQYVRQKPMFLSLLKESPGLGVEIIGHQDLECGLPGDWVCKGGCDGRCGTMCYGCDTPFSDAFAMSHRNEGLWECEKCEMSYEPNCIDCSNTVVWQRRGL